MSDQRIPDGRAAGPELNRRGLLGLGAATAATLAFQLPGARPAAAQQADALRVSINVNPSTLDPVTGRSGGDHQFLFPIYDTLVQWEPATLEPKPGLASSWEYRDELTLALQLRPGLKFHDGTPLDAEAVKFNLDRSRADEKSNIKVDLASVASVETSGPTTVILKLKSPDRSLPLVLTDRAGMMVSPKAVAAGGGSVDRAPVGAGPWKFVKWENNALVAYERNPDYWNREQPKVARLNLRVITEVATGVRSVIAGENDMVLNVPPMQRAVLQKSGKLEVSSEPSLYLHMVYLDFSKPPFNELRVRQAMNLAVDRELFNKATLAGLGEPASTCYPQKYWPHDKAAAALLAYDPDKARFLLKEAGLPKVEFTAIGYADQAAVQRQEVLMEMWRKVGINAKLRAATVAEASTAFFFQRAVDSFIAAITSRPDPSMVPYTIFGKTSPYNGGRQEIPGMEEALAASRVGATQEARQAALAKVQRIAAEHAVYVPLAFDPNVVAMNKRVQGFIPNLLGRPRFENVSVG
ncbi:ABC transporter substrate-binding protein [Camelimonas sp. ID_303_24]